MSFVYAPYHGRHAASDAVDALIDHHIPLRAIRVVSERAGRRQEIPIVHSRPVGTGALIGGVLGLFVGVLAGLILGEEAAASAVVSQAALGVLGGVIGGAFVGALAGLSIWRNRPAFPDSVDDEADVLVGADVEHAREGEVKSALEDAGAASTFVATRV